MPTPEHSNSGMTREQADACIVLLPGCTVCEIPGHGYTVRDDRNGNTYASLDDIIEQLANRGLTSRERLKATNVMLSRAIRIYRIGTATTMLMIAVYLNLSTLAVWLQP